MKIVVIRAGYTIVLLEIANKKIMSIVFYKSE